MSGRSTPQRGGRPQSTRGDFTGQKKEALAQEHEAQVEARRAELSIEGAARAAEDDTVVDLMKDLKAPPGPAPRPEPRADVTTAPAAPRSAAPAAVVEDEDEQPTGDLIDQLPAGTERLSTHRSSFDVFELPEERAVASTPAALADQSQQMEPTQIRVFYDLPDITLGIGNDVSFKGNRKYVVPYWAAKHLEEKQLCDIIG